MTKLVILGPEGMLGGAVWKAAASYGFEPLGTVARIHDRSSMSEISRMRPQVIINCAGVIPPAPGKPGPSRDVEMVLANAVGPLILAEELDCPIIHISTDCVFAGNDEGGHTTLSVPNARDVYGRSKMLAEQITIWPHCTVVRTSFIGPMHGLVVYLQEQAARGHREVNGWLRASWSGSTVDAVARGLLDLALDPPGGLVHLSTSTPVTKCEVVSMIVKQLNLPLRVNPVTAPLVNRALVPTHPLPPLREVIHELSV